MQEAEELSGGNTHTPRIDPDASVLNIHFRTQSLDSYRTKGLDLDFKKLQPKTVSWPLDFTS